MSNTKAKLSLSIAAFGAIAVVACSSGSGEIPILGAAYENHPGDYAKPTEDNQDPSPAQGSAGSVGATDNQGTSEDGGSSGTSGSSGASGTSGSSGAAGRAVPAVPAEPPEPVRPATATSLATSRSRVGARSARALPLVTKDGQCVVSSASSDLTLVCGGTLTSGGQNAGTWANCSKSTTDERSSTPARRAEKAPYGASSARTPSGTSPAARPRVKSSSSACRTSAGASSVSAFAYISR